MSIQVWVNIFFLPASARDTVMVLSEMERSNGV